MLTLYLIGTVVGGVLIGASLLFGDSDIDGDADLALDGDVDLDADAGMELDAHGGHDFGDALSAWFPFASLRFWTFFLAFAGLTGTLLTTLGSIQSALFVALLSGGMGYLSGAGTTKVVRMLQGKEVHSNIGEGDYIGAAGKAILPIRGDKRGKVRLQLKGSVVEAIAQSEDGVDIGISESVVVYGVTSEGHLIVSKTELLEE